VWRPRCKKNTKKHKKTFTGLENLQRPARALLPNSEYRLVRDTMTDGLLRNDGSSVPTVGQGSVSLSLLRWPRLVSAGLVLLAVLAVLGRTARDRERSFEHGCNEYRHAEQQVLINNTTWYRYQLWVCADHWDHIRILWIDDLYKSRGVVPSGQSLFSGQSVLEHGEYLDANLTLLYSYTFTLGNGGGGDRIVHVVFNGNKTAVVNISQDTVLLIGTQRQDGDTAGAALQVQQLDMDLTDALSHENGIDTLIRENADIAAFIDLAIASANKASLEDNSDDAN
jgi:hypothetical protein